MNCRTKVLMFAAVVALSTWSLNAADVKENWTKHCVSCHGKDGKGETKAGKKAGTKDMTDAKYQAALSDEKAFKQINEGMKEGEKERMKAFGDKLTDAEIKDLVAYVRAFKK